jgi:tetratricopeptide (TPR) repeat protein
MSTPKKPKESTPPSSTQVDQEPPPQPTLQGLSRRSQDLLQAWNPNRSYQDEEINEAISSLKQDLEGATLGLLEETLDWIREAGFYELSLPLLEEAWNSDLPLDFHARVIHDWLGTVFFGLDDPKGVIEIVEHITPRIQELGVSFCSEVCDLLLEWGLVQSAMPLAQYATESQPGDATATFHWGICLKANQQWVEAQKCFEIILKQNEDPSTLWNLGICAVAQHQWDVAKRYWTKIGFDLPQEEGDYASPGELSPVRLEDPTGSFPSEIIWGRRLGPARLILTALPYTHPKYRCGDIVIIDGVKAGEVEFRGQKHPIAPVLGTWKASEGESLHLFGIVNQGSIHTARKALNEWIQNWGQQGWAIVDWSTLFPQSTTDGTPLIQVGLYIPPNISPNDLVQTALQTCPMISFYHPRWAELNGWDSDEQYQKWLSFDVQTVYPPFVLH